MHEQDPRPPIRASNPVHSIQQAWNLKATLKMHVLILIKGNNGKQSMLTFPMKTKGNLQQWKEMATNTPLKTKGNLLLLPVIPKRL